MGLLAGSYTTVLVHSEDTMDPITTTIEGARAASGLGRTKLYELIGEGRLEIVKVGRRTLIKTASLRRLLEAA